MQIRWCQTEWLSKTDRNQMTKRMHKLAREGRQDLLDIRVVGRESQHHRNSGHEVAITCSARGRTIVAVRTSDDIEHALHDAFDAFSTQVRGMREKRRQHNSQHNSLRDHRLSTDLPD